MNSKLFFFDSEGFLSAYTDNPAFFLQRIAMLSGADLMCLGLIKNCVEGIRKNY